MKRVLLTRSAPPGHWVGDGFPVRSLLFYGDEVGERISPFLLLDHAGPAEFPPTDERRGVGEHPHRGFETVTIVYHGQVEHHDSAGNRGTIGPGDVQWMTAARGVIHEEYHGTDFRRTGGAFEMVQLWVNLPAAHKMSPPRYQAIRGADIPAVEIAEGAGRVRIVAGEYGGTTGAARTVTPVDVWDARLAAGASAELPLPDGRVAVVVFLDGALAIGEGRLGTGLGTGEIALLGEDGAGVALRAEEDTRFLLLHGEPLGEPVVGRGPFVMNTEAEIRQAMVDFAEGRFA